MGEIISPTKTMAKRRIQESDWKIQPLTRKRVHIDFGRRFTVEEMRQIKMGFRPAQMEDKWFVYFKDNHLFFHRSWTGICIYIVAFTQRDGGYFAENFMANRNFDEYKQTDDATDRDCVSWLIDSLLLHDWSAPPKLSDNEGDSTLSAWSFAGRAILNEHPKDNSPSKKVEANKIKEALSTQLKKRAEDAKLLKDMQKKGSTED